MTDIQLYVILAAGVYLMIYAITINASKPWALIVYKLIPFFLGLYTMFFTSKTLGWL